MSDQREEDTPTEIQIARRAKLPPTTPALPRLPHTQQKNKYTKRKIQPAEGVGGEGHHKEMMMREKGRMTPSSVSQRPTASVTVNRKTRAPMRTRTHRKGEKRRANTAQEKRSTQRHALCGRKTRMKKGEEVTTWSTVAQAQPKCCQAFSLDGRRRGRPREPRGRAREVSRNRGTDVAGQPLEASTPTRLATPFVRLWTVRENF